MSDAPLIRELKDNGVLVLTLNRPDTMNALNGEIIAGLTAAVQDSRTDDTIRAIVITGSGAGFCSGADLTGGGPARAAGELPGRSALVDKIGPGKIVMAFADSAVPIIGAINGATAGAGFGLALCCDIRIASDRARMGSVFIKRGIATDYGASYWLPRLVGVSRALDILYTGALLDAQTLLGLGLVNRVVPHESLLDETLAYAGMIAQGPPLGYAYSRQNIVRSLDMDIRAQLEMEWSRQSELLRTQDAREGFAAFRERRTPSFTGH